MLPVHAPEHFWAFVWLVGAVLPPVFACPKTATLPQKIVKINDKLKSLYKNPLRSFIFVLHEKRWVTSSNASADGEKYQQGQTFSVEKTAFRLYFEQITQAKAQIKENVF